MSNEQQGANRHRGLVLRLVAMAAGMFAFGFLLVPLYDVFCEITGIRSAFSAADVSNLPLADRDRLVNVEFIATPNVNAPWEFRPRQSTMQVQVGKLYEATYQARNLTGRALVGNAIPDVKPAQAAKYFQKTECFCFTPQSFAAEQARELPVRFIIDPELPAHIDTITLSYSFYTAQAPIAARQ